MKYPGYLLNPGDLFQVHPERVMFAAGAPKEKAERRAGRLARKAAAETQQSEAENAEEAVSEETRAEQEVEEKQDPRDTLKVLMSQAKTIMSRDKSVLPAKRKQEIRGFQKAIRSVLSRSASSKILTDN